MIAINLMTKPLVDLLELGPDGAMIAWYEVESRAVALSVVVHLAEAFVHADGQSLRLTLTPAWQSVPTVSALTLEEFIDRTSNVLCRYNRYCLFELAVGERRVFAISPLDQSLDGVSFTLLDAPKYGASLPEALQRVLLHARAEHPDVDFLLGPLEYER